MLPALSAVIRRHQDNACQGRDIQVLSFKLEEDNEVELVFTYKHKTLRYIQGCSKSLCAADGYGTLGYMAARLTLTPSIIPNLSFWHRNLTFEF
jgi:hypothetical protein